MISAPLHAGTADQALTTGFEVTTPSSRFVEKIPRDFARLHMVVSAGTDEVTGCERLLVSSKTPSHIPHNVGTRLGAPTRCVVNDDESIAARIDAAYTALGVASEDKIEIRQGEAQSGEVDRLLAAADRDLLSTAGKGPVVRLVDAMLFEALAKGASDVHIQPLADRVLARYRVDGVLLTARVLPRHVAEAVSGRIKVMGRMDVAERRIPQDGRAGVSIGADTAGRKVDLRISSLPTSHGERIVVRLLDTSQGRKLATLDDLGMPIDVHGRYLHMASRPQGVILLTGPTGSGKTTTLYATLRWIAGHSTDGQRSSDGTLNVMTIEDPIEYELSGLGVSISQAQVNTKKGVTFASGLRHILRQ
ncbi:MAG: Flp pilus assembly complex ATPase component TadA, partial [Phycisphaerales bacterium]|nr:Flp pilus assembly complex ATPase component TadA [Phycisphaerales bacterium]